MTETANTVLAPKSGTQVGNAVIPAEGPIAVPYNLNFALSLSFSINVRDLLNTGPGYPGLTRIQALWIDNSQKSAEMIVSITQTNQFIYVPGQSQGYYSVLSPNSGQINFSTGAGPLVYVTVLNFPVGGNQWYPSGVELSGDNFTFTGGYLNTLDATLAAIKGTTTSANAIPVDVVNTSSSNLWYSANPTPNSSPQTIITATGNGIRINSIYAKFSSTSYISGGALQQVDIVQQTTNNVIFGNQFYLPTSALTASATQAVEGYTVFNLNNLNMFITGSINLYYPIALSAGELFLTIGYQQASS